VRSVALGFPRHRRHGLGVRGECFTGDDLEDLLLGDLLVLLVVLCVAQHAEVAAHAAVDVDRDPRQHLLALLEAEPLHVEVREADPIRGVRGVLAIVGVDRDREALEVLGDPARVDHRPAARVASGQLHWVDGSDRTSPP
jgi:hypothetical protein